MGFWRARGWDVDHAVSAVASHIDGDIARPTGRGGVSVPRSPPDGGAATPAEPQDWAPLRDGACEVALSLPVEGEGELSATSAHRAANGVFVFLGHEPWSRELLLSPFPLQTAGWADRDSARWPLNRTLSRKALTAGFE